MKPPMFVLGATIRLSAAALMVVAASGAVPLQADPATTSSLPWKTAAGALAVAGSTMYVAGGGNIVPRANIGFGLAVFPVNEALGEPVAASNGDVHAVIPDGSGGWYVGGRFTQFGGLPRSGLARVLASGAVDPAFVANIGQFETVHALALNGSQLIAGGNFTAVNLVPRTRLAVVNAATGLVQAPAPVLNGDVNVLAIAGSTLLVGGTFSTAGGDPHAGLAAFAAAAPGVPLAFSANVNAGGSVSALAVSGSSVYVGGNFTSVNTVPRANLAKVSLASGFVEPAWNPFATGAVAAIAVDGSVVYVGGAFAMAGGQTRHNLAALDANTGVATAWRADTSSVVLALQLGTGSLFALGPFQTVNGMARRGAANISTSTPATVLPWSPSVGQVPRAVAVSGGRVAVAGTIEGWGVRPRRSITAIDLLSGELLPFAPVALGNGVYDLLVTGSRLVAAGEFTEIDGTIRTNVAAFALGSHELLPFSIAIDGAVFTMAAIGDTLFIGGTFATVNGVSRLNLAAIDLNTSQLLPWDVQADSRVSSIATHGDRVFVGGSFTSLVGANGFRMRAGLGEITTDGVVTAFDAGITSAFTPIVSAVTVRGNSLYFTGNFSLVQGEARVWAGAVNATTGAVLPWDPRLDNPASMSIHRGFVYLAGSFSFAGGQPRRGVVRVDDTIGALSPWAPSPALGSGRAVVAFDAGVAVTGVSLVGQDFAQFFPEQALGGPPGLPTQLSARVVGATLSLNWAPPVMGPRPTGYVLEAGSGPGLSDIATLPMAGTSFSVAGVPPGTYFLRVRAVGAGGGGAASGEVAVGVGSPSCTAPPLTPTVPVVTVAGASIVLSWQASSGSAPTAFTLQVGSAPGLTNIGAIGVGGATSFATAGVPAGAYFVRVLAANACGFGVPAPDALVRVGGAPGPPSVPVQLTGASAGGVVSLAWISTTSGGTPTSHLLEVGTGPGLSNIGMLPLGAAPTLTAPGVPPGTYYLRVRAENGAGASAASNELVLVVP